MIEYKHSDNINRKYPENCPGCGKKLYSHFNKVIVRGDANNWWPHDWEKCKRLSEIEFRDTWVPIERESEIKCNITKCAAGMGLAGNGHCFLVGNPYIGNCPKFIDEKEMGCRYGYY